MKEMIIFIDSGDTLIDESTQVHDEHGIVQEAAFIEGAEDLLDYFKSHQLRVCLVADGEWDSFKNVFEKNGRRDDFEGWIISEKIGVQKPEKPMFDAAMEVMDLKEEDKDRIVMIGNNLKKDIAGANRYGLTSIWLSWSPRYFHEVEESDWQPDYEAATQKELIELIDQIRKQ